MVKSKSEHQLKLSKLFMIPDHPTYGFHQVLVHQSLVYSITDSRPLNLPLMKRTEPSLTLLMDQVPLLEHVDLMLPLLVVFPLEPPSEKLPKNQEFLSLLHLLMESQEWPGQESQSMELDHGSKNSVTIKLLMTVLLLSMPPKTELITLLSSQEELTQLMPLVNSNITTLSVKPIGQLPYNQSKPPDKLSLD